MLGLWPDKGTDFANLTAYEGFAPNGLVAIFSGIVVVFSMVGAEIVTIAAAESENPERAVIKATSSVVMRILLFYVGSIFLLVTILPWNDAKLGDSPYVAALDVMGIPAAADIMNAVVLTAVLSCLNSGIYTASRVLFTLSRRGDAPIGLLEVNRRGVPVKAILSCTVVARGVDRAAGALSACRCPRRRGWRQGRTGPWAIHRLVVSAGQGCGSRRG